MTKKKTNSSKLSTKLSQQLLDDINDDIGVSVRMWFNDRRFLVASTVRPWCEDEESDKQMYQLKGGKLQVLLEDEIFYEEPPAIGWEDVIDLELEELKAFLLEGVVDVLRERGVIA